MKTADLPDNLVLGSLQAAALCIKVAEKSDHEHAESAVSWLDAFGASMHAELKRRGLAPQSDLDH